MGCNVTAIWRAHRRGAAMANPCFTQIHPTCIPQTGDYQSKLTLMSESLRNDGRVWVPRDRGRGARRPRDIPESDRYYYLEERYPRFGNLVPRDVASRAAKIVCDEGLGVGPTGRAVYLDFRDAIAERGAPRRSRAATGTCSRCTSGSPAIALGGADEDLPGARTTRWAGCGSTTSCRRRSRACSRSARRTSPTTAPTGSGASAMMQCLADGYFIVPHTVTN